MDPNTMGIVWVARCAASVAAAPEVTITSTLARIRSLAKSGKHSLLPAAQRYSMTKFRPST